MKLVEDWDQNSANPSISVGGVKQKQNICGGILGILFWIILALILIQKAIVVLGKQ
jgi:hypothetical protein